MTSPSEQFNAMIGNAMNKPEVVGHPDDEKAAADLLEQIEAVGGATEVWKPVTYGRIVRVENYDSSDERLKQEFNITDVAEFREKYNLTATRSQKVVWIDNKGLYHAFGWNNGKREQSKVDHSDFPNGYSENDYIKMICEGAAIQSIHRVTLEEVQTEDR